MPTSNNFESGYINRFVPVSTCVCRRVGFYSSECLGNSFCL